MEIAVSLQFPVADRDARQTGIVLLLGVWRCTNWRDVVMEMIEKQNDADVLCYAHYVGQYCDQYQTCQSSSMAVGKDLLASQRLQYLVIGEWIVDCSLLLSLVECDDAGRSLVHVRQPCERKGVVQKMTIGESDQLHLTFPCILCIHRYHNTSKFYIDLQSSGSSSKYCVSAGS